MRAHCSSCYHPLRPVYPTSVSVAQTCASCGKESLFGVCSHIFWTNVSHNLRFSAYGNKLNVFRLLAIMNSKYPFCTTWFIACRLHSLVGSFSICISICGQFSLLATRSVVLIVFCVKPLLTQDFSIPNAACSEAHPTFSCRVSYATTAS